MALSRTLLSHLALTTKELLREAAVGRNKRLVDDIFVRSSYEAHICINYVKILTLSFLVRIGTIVS